MLVFSKWENKKKMKLFSKIYFHNINKVSILYIQLKTQDKLTATFEYLVILRKVMCQDDNKFEEKLEKVKF